MLNGIIEQVFMLLQLLKNTNRRRKLLFNYVLNVVNLWESVGKLTLKLRNSLMLIVLVRNPKNLRFHTILKQHIQIINTI